jgi:hypothetical protein
VPFLPVLFSDFSLQACVQEDPTEVAGSIGLIVLVICAGAWRKVTACFPEVLTDRLGFTHLLECLIQLKDTRSVRSAPYR